MRLIFPAFSIFCLAVIAPAEACRLPPKSLLVSPEKILGVLDTQAQPLLKAMDDFAGDIEACYDAPLGLLEMAEIRDGAATLRDHMDAVRGGAEARVRGDELNFEDLLSSDIRHEVE